MTQQTALRNKKLLAGIFISCVIFGLLAVLAVASIPLLYPPAVTQSQPPQTTAPSPPASLYAPEDFVTDENGYISCAAGQSRMGIDISAFQGEIDFSQVKQSGVDFVMIRVGGRGYGPAGSLYADTRAQEYYRQAKQAGLQVGAYFFSQATCVAEAVEEAVYALYLTTGWELDMPLAYDWEVPNMEARTVNVSGDMLMDCTLSFCELVRLAGREPMIYFNQNQAKNLLELTELTDYPWWLAMYEETYTYPYQVDCWQYSCTGAVAGIDGNVDLNLYFPPV